MPNNILSEFFYPFGDPLSDIFQQILLYDVVLAHHLVMLDTLFVQKGK